MAISTANNPEQIEGGEWALALQDLDNELQRIQSELAEITGLHKQSKIEVEKLTQRNAAANAQLQQIQARIQDTAPTDIQSGYDAALEAQQRLVVMRGQMERLESDREHLQKTLSLLQKIRDAAPGNLAQAADADGAPSSIEVMIQAQESERQRLSRQMHDGPAQTLSNFILQTEIALRLFDVNSDDARKELNELKRAASATFQKVREFIFDLRPMMLDDLGLVPTIKRYAENYAEKSGLEVQVSLAGKERRIEPYLEIIVFRAVQELLTNASLHEQATQIKILLDISNEEIRVNIEDNGRGFEAQSLPDEAELGAKAIRERVDMLGGTFEVDSAVGKGSRFALTFPIIFEKEGTS